MAINQKHSKYTYVFAKLQSLEQQSVHTNHCRNNHHLENTFYIKSEFPDIILTQLYLKLSKNYTFWVNNLYHLCQGKLLVTSHFVREIEQLGWTATNNYKDLSTEKWPFKK
ncbi:hypothetical protein QTP88_000356 [Uroleucon formosanum]